MANQHRNVKETKEVAKAMVTITEFLGDCREDYVPFPAIMFHCSVKHPRLGVNQVISALSMLRTHYYIWAETESETGITVNAFRIAG